MSSRMGLMMGMAGGGKILARGTYIPETDGTAFTIDTGVTGFKYFVIGVRLLPYTEGFIRCFGSMFVNVDGNYALFTYGPSTASNKPNTGSYSILGGSYASINGSVVQKGGIASVTGTLKTGVEYDWFCWN